MPSNYRRPSVRILWSAPALRGGITSSWDSTVTHSPGKAFVVYEIKRHVYPPSMIVQLVKKKREIYLADSTITYYHALLSAQGSSNPKCGRMTHILCFVDLASPSKALVCGLLDCVVACLNRFLPLRYVSLRVLRRRWRDLRLVECDAI